MLFAVTDIDDILLLSLFFVLRAGRGARGTMIPNGVPRHLPAPTVWQAWKHRDDKDEDDAQEPAKGGPRTLEVAAVTFANGDNTGVYVPGRPVVLRGAASWPPAWSSPRRSAGGGPSCSR